MWWNQRHQHQSPWKAWPCLCLTHPGLSAAERWTPPGWSAHPRPCQTAAGERTDRRHVPLFICRLRDISNMARLGGGEESLQWSGLCEITFWSSREHLTLWPTKWLHALRKQSHIVNLTLSKPLNAASVLPTERLPPNALPQYQPESRPGWFHLNLLLFPFLLVILYVFFCFYWNTQSKHVKGVDLSSGSGFHHPNMVL